jgi:hypothetical protein
MPRIAGPSFSLWEKYLKVLAFLPLPEETFAEGSGSAVMGFAAGV